MFNMGIDDQDFTESQETPPEILENDETNDEIADDDEVDDESDTTLT